MAKHYADSWKKTWNADAASFEARLGTNVQRLSRKLLPEPKFTANQIDTSANVGRKALKLFQSYVKGLIRTYHVRFGKEIGLRAGVQGSAVQKIPEGQKN